MKKLILLQIIVVFILNVLRLHGANTPITEYQKFRMRMSKVKSPSAQLWVREEKNVVVNGITEVWKLVWGKEPTECCMPKNTDALGNTSDIWQTPYNCNCG